MTEIVEARVAVVAALAHGRKYNREVKLHYGEPVAEVIFKEIFGERPNQERLEIMKRAIEYAITEELPEKSVALLSLIFGEKTHSRAETAKCSFTVKADDMSVRECMQGALAAIELRYMAMASSLN